MSKLVTTAALLLTLVGGAIGPAGASSSSAPTPRDLSGVMNHDEWSRIDPPDRKSEVNDACNCSGTWTGEDGNRDGWYYREFEYLHSGGFSLIYYRHADDDTWKVFWKKRWVDYDGPDETEVF